MSVGEGQGKDVESPTHREGGFGLDSELDERLRRRGEKKR